VILNLEIFSSAYDAVVSTPAAERTLCDALDAAEMASSDSRFRRTYCNHIFLNVMPTVRIDVKMCKKYVEDCSYGRPLVAGCCVSLLSKSKQARCLPNVRNPVHVCLLGCF
jgi:Acetyl-CoA carboxylase, central region